MRQEIQENRHEMVGKASFPGPPQKKKNGVQTKTKRLTSSICLSPRSGFQSFFSVFTQISPLAATFGWKIFVKKNAFGGVCGKSLPSVSFALNRPPMYGVPRNKTNSLRFHRSRVGKITCRALDVRLNVGHVLLVDQNFDSFRRVRDQILHFSHDAPYDLRGEILDVVRHL